MRAGIEILSFEFLSLECFQSPSLAFAKDGNQHMLTYEAWSGGVSLVLRLPTFAMGTVSAFFSLGLLHHHGDGDDDDALTACYPRQAIHGQT